MRVVVYTLPQHGHVNPMLALVRELTERGHEVVFYLTEEFRPKIEAAGGTFRSLGVDANFDLYAHARDAAAARRDGSGLRPTDAVGVFLELMATVMAGLDTLAASLATMAPDLVLYDPMSVWGQILARNSPARRATFYPRIP